jgi:hypothetical protein
MGKRVCFAEKAIVYNMFVWSFAYCESRKGYCWIMASVDANRFKRRIKKSESLLGNIFDANFRKRVYEERFKK